MTTNSLRRLYEDPATTVKSGSQRAERQAQMLVEVTNGSTSVVRAVDIGCGDGSSTRYAIDACQARDGTAVTILGFDWSLPALAQARQQGVTVVCASLEGAGLPLATASIDVVIMGEIIEHLVDTDAALAEARRLLRPGGWLLLSTPNLAAWFNRGLLLFGVQPLFSEVSLRGIYGRPGSEVVGHLHLFTRRALVELLAANGFVNTKVSAAPYHDVPRPLRPLDRLMCAFPSASSILLVATQAPS
jgi:SAM-dependent methyltransferase